MHAMHACMPQSGSGKVLIYVLLLSMSSSLTVHVHVYHSHAMMVCTAGFEPLNKCDT